MACKKVLVTGVTGYVGSWCAHVALEAGYRVVGTVRDLNSSKCRFLHEAIAGRSDGKLSARARSHLSLVEADLLSGDDRWDAVLKEGKFDFVIHTASPYFAKAPADEVR